jgi:hypothetical protein
MVRAAIPANYVTSASVLLSRKVLMGCASPRPSCEQSAQVYARKVVIEGGIREIHAGIFVLATLNSQIGLFDPRDKRTFTATRRVPNFIYRSFILSPQRICHLLPKHLLKWFTDDPLNKSFSSRKIASTPEKLTIYGPVPLDPD